MRWFAVRTIYVHSGSDSGAQWYLERHVLFRAADLESAGGLAEAESSRYLELNPEASLVGNFNAFSLHEGVADLHGAEVWSMPRDSDDNADDFLERHYTNLEPQLTE